MRYKIVGDYVQYGGPKEYKRNLYGDGLSLFEAAKMLVERFEVPEDSVVANRMMKTKEDNTGCYHRLELLEDWSVNAIWNGLSNHERYNLFSYAESWMLNEMVEVPELANKIKGFEQGAENGEAKKVRENERHI